MSFLKNVDDVRIDELRSLIAPEIIMHEFAPEETDVEFIREARSETEAILKGTSDKLLVVVGPCSIHDPAAAKEYAAKLKEESAKHEDNLHIVMRVYFEKPRTTVGWKGLINDPNLDESCDINKGLRMARELLLHLTQLRLAAGTELLDTISPQYIADLVTWGAIGARTTESQVHRELASGLSMPVGFKNGTAGSIGIAVDAIRAAQGAHQFLSVTKQGVCAIVKTKGNPCCHVILRGSKSGPNYEAEHVESVSNTLKEAKLEPYLMIDCSHGNSEKDHKRQPLVGANLCEQIAGGENRITSVMVESNLVEGNQKVKPGEELVYGQSITDACVDWDTTVEMLDAFSAAVQARREKSNS